MSVQSITKAMISTAIATLLLSPAGIATAQENLALEEITVTAQKRAQSLQDVPIAISAMTSDQMAAAGIQDMSDISHQMPVLEVQTSVTSAATNFRMRRVGNIGNIPTFESAVGVFIDGAYRSRAVFGASELFDLERIEVLRGPQSTLYGKNTTAGVVGIYTAEPGEEFGVRAELTSGAYDAENSANLFRFKGGLGGPMSETLRGSLGLSYATHDETMTQALATPGEDANDRDRMSARAQFVWDASDKLSLRLILGYLQQDDKTTTSDIFYDPAGPLVNGILPTFQAFGVSVPCSDNDGQNRIGCSRVANTTDFESSDATLITQYDLANGLGITSITSWDTFRTEGTVDDVAQVSAPIARFHDTQEADSLQQELRLVSPGGEKVDWLTGVFWYNNTFNRGDNGNRPMFLSDTFSAHPVVSAVLGAAFVAPGFNLPMANPGELAFLDAEQETNYIGVFGQATWNISERFSITGGLRWQEEEKDAYIRQWTNDPALSVLSLAISPAGVGAEGLNRSTDEVTWSFTPQYFVSDDTMLFATVSHGFKSGGFNVGFGTMPIANREFGDEDIMHFEAGFKSTLLEGRMNLAGSVFTTDYDDYQDAAFIGAQFTVGNAEKAELRGAELEGQWLLSEDWSTDFALSYASFEYATYSSGMCYPGRVPDSITTPGACVLDGENPINAPEWKTHLGLQYDHAVSWGDIFARLDWSWTDEYNTSFSADPLLVQDAYSWINLRAGTSWGDGRFELIAWADNLGDEVVVDTNSVLNLFAVDGSYQSFIQNPRSYGLTLRANF